MAEEELDNLTLTETEKECEREEETDFKTAKEQTEKVAPPAPQKKKIGHIVWNIVLIALIAVGILSLFGIVNEIGPGAGTSFKEVFGNIHWGYAALLLGVIICVMCLDSSKFCIITKTVTGKIRLPMSVKTSFLGKYYDAVTPFSTGGQPMQIVYLNSKGISGGNSSAIVMIKYFSSIITWVMLGAGLMIAGSFMGVLDGNKGATILKITGWIGIGVNLIIPLFVTFFLVFPKIMHRLTVGLVKLGNKIKLVKDVEKTTARAIKIVDDFKNSFKVMATTPVNLILLLIVSFGEAFFTFSIPFFVMKAFSCDVHGQLITIMALNAFATFGVSFVPTPGNSGVMEGMAALAFSAAAGATLVWSVIVWRFGVYYIYIIIGLCITVRDVIKRNLRRKKAHSAKE